MPNLILFDEPKTRAQLLPFTFTRPIAEIRTGILTIREKWEKHYKATASFFSEEYLSDKFPMKIEEDNLLINSCYLPTQELIAAINNLQHDEALVDGEEIIAVRCNHDKTENFLEHFLRAVFKNISYYGSSVSIKNVWDIFMLNGKAMEMDFDFITADRTSQKLNATNTIIGNGKIFIEEGAVVNAAILNTSTGCIYIGKDTEVMEGSVVRGPFALCEHATLKLSSKIYGATTIGPHSKVGGEVNNSVIFGYSNKAHDGFLGNAVIGEWCNLGADTNNSNLKNNYANVKLWSYAEESFTDSGLQFCGLFMGDHSKCGINTMFNTGTIVGVSANIFGSGFPRNFIPSFSWGGTQGFSTYKLEQAFETARLVMERRGLKLTVEDEKILEHVFYHDEKFRKP
jgi:UDP-N-acetylglucosamine diphosphorylase/glucosamine-1-phosphate N-acetyltransferase